MIAPSFPGSVDSSTSSPVRPGSGSVPPPQSFKPFGKYADIGSQKVKSSRPGIRLHVGSTSTMYLNKGNVLGKDITFISQVWTAWDSESVHMFYEQVLPYIRPETLRPLMGVCVPTVVGVYSTAAGGLSLAMELPHPVGWRPADPYISDELKEKVVTAYQRIHGRNILHNDVKLENILIGDNDEVTIVDFCKMVANPEPADLVLEMRAIKFMLDYQGAKETEYERLRRADSRTGTNRRRSWIRRAAESLGLASEVECDELPPQDEIACPPFSREWLMKWDSEVVTEGTTHCPGWRGERFEVPEDMRSSPWQGTEDCTPPSPPPYQPIDFAGLVKAAFDSKPFNSHGQWMKDCHYLSYLWSPSRRSAKSGRKGSFGTASPASSSEFSDRLSGSEHSSTSGIDPFEGDGPISPAFGPQRRQTEDPARLHDRPRGDKHSRKSKSAGVFTKHEGDQTFWATRKVEKSGLPSPLKLRRKRKGSPPFVLSSAKPPPLELRPPAPVDLSPDHRKVSTGCIRSPNRSSRRRGSTSTDSGRSLPSSRRSSVTGSSLSYSPRPTTERKCCVVIMDSDFEDKVWFLSRDALEDVKGYLRGKMATGTAMELRLGGEEGEIRYPRMPVENILGAPLTRKLANIQGGDYETPLRPRRRRSWPDLYS